MEGDVRFLPVDRWCLCRRSLRQGIVLYGPRRISLYCSRASAPTFAAACRCARACVCVRARACVPCYICAGDWRRPCHTGTGAEPTLTRMRRDWPHRRRTCRERTAATSAPGLGFEWPSSHLSARLPCAGDSYLATSRYVCRRNMNDQLRCVRSILHTVDDSYRCHDGTAPVL